MTQVNKGFEAFRKAADEIKPTPKHSSWDRLETMLDNKSLSQKNKSYKNLIQWICGSAALILLCGSILFIYNSRDNTHQNNQLAYTLEALQENDNPTNSLYDIDKLAQLNDAELWSNIVEGGPKLKAKKVSMQ